MRILVEYLTLEINMNGCNQGVMKLKEEIDLKVNLNTRLIFHLHNHKEILIFEPNEMVSTIFRSKVIRVWHYHHPVEKVILRSCYLMFA